MKHMTSAEVREAFLSYFEEQRHKQVASSSLVPGNDPTLLFANAGMVQFKDVFLGTDKRDYKRATTSQKCMRVSGKHNDLEEVGFSPRHHTFFEMLGNFSFGDYFKLEAMQFAWQLLTEVYGLPADRLAVTVYEKDDESYNLWHEKIGIPSSRIGRLGPDANFWQMADTGPCGPCSEIHWDKYPERGEDNIVPSLEEDDDRFLEIWNLVFMQYNRTQADPNHTGEFDELLPAPSVDTGMGLERIVSILQGVTNNYDTDLFTSIITKTQAITGHTDAERDANIVPYRVIADHIRAAVFLIADGVLPGAKGRDSVCRLVLRRAARFGAKIGLTQPFLSEVAQAVIDHMGDHYTELKDRADAIKRTISREEERFSRTMETGLAELNALLAELPNGGTLSGEKAFFLKSTLGLPTQVIKDIAEEQGYHVDMAEFDSAEEEHAKVSGGGQAMGVITDTESYKSVLDSLQSSGTLSDSGVAYDPYIPADQPFNAQVIALLQNGAPAQGLSVGDKVEVVLNQTSFYVESGGQVSDTGVIVSDDWEIEVEDTRRPVGGLIIHLGEVVKGHPEVGAHVTGIIDAQRRTDIIRNHTATHILHAALRNHLGTHVQQRGSLVAPDRLRFDFAHDAKVTDDELHRIEHEVNTVILSNLPVHWEYKPLTQARAEGAMALFGEKYGDTVRTVVIGEGDNRYSYELCGGVHVNRTIDVGTFIITTESSTSAGVRRVEALTGQAAIDYLQRQKRIINHIAQRFNTPATELVNKLGALLEEVNLNKKQIETLRREVARAVFESRVTNLEQIGGITVMTLHLENTPIETLREMSDWFKHRSPSGIFVVGTNNDEKPQLLVTVTDDLVKLGYHAGNIVKEMAQTVGGGGGGRPNMAQAGGKDSSKLSEALDVARKLIATMKK
jgi:alanyl-tRNA synthetase